MIVRDNTTASNDFIALGVPRVLYQVSHPKFFVHFEQFKLICQILTVCFKNFVIPVYFTMSMYSI